MSTGSDKIVDKNKRNIKYIAIASFSLILFVIVVRSLSVNINGDSKLNYTGPEYDSVALPTSEGKIEQYKKEEQEAKQKEFALQENNPEAVNVNFEKLYGKETKTVAEVKEVKAVEQKEVQASSTRKRNNSDNNGYVEANNYENYNEKIKERKQKEHKEVVEEPKQSVAQQPVQEQKSTNPFGTQSVIKNKVNQGINEKDMYKCVVHADQKVPNGGGIIVRAFEDMVIGGKKVLKNSLLYGIATYNNNRVKIVITRIKTTTGDLAVACSVYDNDYIEGIFFKNAYDKAVDKSTEDVGGAVGDQVGGVVGTGIKVVNDASKNVGQAIKNDRKLNVQEGYILYIKEIKR